MKSTIYIFLLIFFQIQSILSAPFNKRPVEIVLPNASLYTIYESGDEFYSWYHDANNFTIIFDNTIQRYAYANVVNDQLLATTCFVGISNPTTCGLVPGLNYSVQKIESFGNFVPELNFKSLNAGSELKNLVVFVTFSDYNGENPLQQLNFSTSKFESDFNGNNYSLKGYFAATSASCSLTSITFNDISNSSYVPFRCTQPINYYLPYHILNPIGYLNTSEKISRKNSLLVEICNFIQSKIPQNYVLSLGEYIDNMAIIYPERKSDFKFAEKYGVGLYYPIVQEADKWQGGFPLTINGKKLNRFFGAVNYADYLFVCAHELHHILHNFNDLYRSNDSKVPNAFVGTTCIMSNSLGGKLGFPNPYFYSQIGGGAPRTIVVSGTYNITAMTRSDLSGDKVFRLPIGIAPNYPYYRYYLYFAYRKPAKYDNGITTEGMYFYLVDLGGNYSQYSPEVYMYRKDGILPLGPNSVGKWGDIYNDGVVNNAAFTETLRSYFDHKSNPIALDANGQSAEIYIYNIRKINDDQMSFDVNWDCDNNNNQTFQNTLNLPKFFNAAGTIDIIGNSGVLIGQNVNLESKESVLLGNGFFVEKGGIFNISIEGCKK